MITRQKNRYVLVESTSNMDLRDRVVVQNILDALVFETGGIGFVRANPKIVQQTGEKRFVMRVNRGCEDGVVLALLLPCYTPAALLFTSLMTWPTLLAMSV